MQTLWQDLRYGARLLIKQPAFTLIAALTLALGVGANTAIFSLLHQVLLRALPVREPEQLVVLASPGPKQGSVSSDTRNGAESFSYPMYRDLRDRNDVFAGVLARYVIPLNVAFGGQSDRASGELVSGNYFEVLGVTPALGRVFSQEDDRTPGAHPVVVLSHGFWTRRFAANPGVLNQTMTINGQQMTIVGVTRAGFTGVQLGQMPDAFVTMAMKAQMMPLDRRGLDDHRSYWLNMLARLKPGVTREVAQARLAPLYRNLLDAELPLQSGMSAETQKRFVSKPLLVEPGARGRSVFQRDSGTPLLVLMSMTVLVLLIACANVAGLLVARGAARRKEIAVRQALGAGRFRLVRQLLVESVLLAGAGGALGLLVAGWTLAWLVKAMPESNNLGALTADLNYGLLAFNFGLAVVTGLLFGLAPALRTTRTDLVTSLKEQGASASAGIGQSRFRQGLVVAEVALTSVLLVAAGLCARSFVNLLRVDAGVRTEHLLTFSLSPSLNGYDAERTKLFFSQLETALRAVPGVEAVSEARVGIFSGNRSSGNITVEGYTAAPDEDMDAMRNEVGTGHFATLGVPLIAGREFGPQDTAQSQKVAIINQTLARRFFGDANPIGRHLMFGQSNKQAPDIEIVGVVRDSKHTELRDGPERFIYLPWTQTQRLGELTFYVRTAQPPANLMPALRREVARLDASLPLYDVRTLEEQIATTLAGERLLALLSSAFGVLAALLAAVGMYGVISYSVAQRTQELGIRKALGAQLGDVLRLVIGQGMKLALIGVAIGLVGAFAATRLMATALFGVGAADPMTFVAVALLLIVVALLACYIPARRAAKIDPMIALRYE